MFYSRVRRSPKKEQFRTTIIVMITAGQIKSSYNTTTRHSKSAIAMILMNSPIRKITGAFSGLTFKKIPRFAAKRAFGKAQARPLSNAETAASSPPSRAENAAITIVAKICRYTIFLIKSAKPPLQIRHYARIIRKQPLINKRIFINLLGYTLNKKYYFLFPILHNF